MRTELTECEAARDDFFDDCDRHLKRIKELEKRELTPERCVQILKALKSGPQADIYKRVAAVLVEICEKPWR